MNTSFNKRKNVQQEAIAAVQQRQYKIQFDYDINKEDPMDDETLETLIVR